MLYYNNKITLNIFEAVMVVWINRSPHLRRREFESYHILSDSALLVPDDVKGRRNGL